MQTIFGHGFAMEKIHLPNGSYCWSGPTYIFITSHAAVGMGELRVLRSGAAAPDVDDIPPWMVADPSVAHPQAAVNQLNRARQDAVCGAWVDVMCLSLHSYLYLHLDYACKEAIEAECTCASALIIPPCALIATGAIELPMIVL